MPKTFLTCLVATTALAGWSNFAAAAELDDQGTPQSAAGAAAADAEPADTSAPIIVTGSRIERAGFVAPTPTVVVGVEALRDRAAVNVADVLNEIPSFRRTQAPESGGIGNSGANNIDLRGLTPVRTLVLVDRLRLTAVNVPGATVSGATDLNLIPAALIKRVDVVTGGASAAYGSDAIAGVVNLQLDTRLQGLKGNVQYGQTKYEDAKSVFASLAGGTSFAGGRGHVIFGGEFDNNQGTDLFNTKRDWGSRNVSSVSLPANRAAGLPANLITDNVIFGTLTTGGLITPTATSNPAALRNLQFVVGSNGAVTTTPFDAGLYQGQVGTNMVGGTNVNPYQVLRAKTRRYNLLGNVNYELGDDTEVWAQGMYSFVRTQNISAQIRAATGGTTSFLSLSKDNPYLQAALTPAQLALIPAGGSLTIGYLGNDFGPPQQEITNRTYRFAGGFKGRVGDGWRWDISAQYGQAQSEQVTSNVAITGNFLNAINAVSMNGTVVCASAAARAAGCRPINILGKASYSPEAYDYAFGTSNAKATTSLLEVAANVNGEPFSLWAGPVSVGFGAEFRRETFKTEVDAISQAGLFMARAPRNFPKVGQSVTEAYLETIVPLLPDEAGLGTLNLNGAVRATDYSISGGVKTWKAGLVWQPIPDIMLRGTVSRDIRAPSLTELFTPSALTVPRPTIRDNRTPFASLPVYAYDVVTGGNSSLKPEKARTTSFGIVVNPGFLKRLQISVDYYRIRVSDAIGAVGAATAITNCIGTTASSLDIASPYCSLITFANNDPQNGAVQSVVANNSNFAEFKTSGFDIGVSYVQPVDEIFAGADGRITFNAQATHVKEYKSTFDVSRTFPDGINRAGQTGAIFGGSAGLPSWLVNSTLAYRGERFEANMQVRWISKSHFNNGLIGPDDAAYDPTSAISINNNVIPSVTYVNMGASYNFGSQENRREIYISVNNLFDKDPPLPAINNNAYYDLLGRTYRIGARFNF